MFGNNPIRHQELNDGKNLWVQSVFYTLQGEGPFIGKPALFVRLAGCNLACFWCDTDFESSEWHPTLDELMARIDAERPPQCNLIVITGGEPFRQNIAPLVERLLGQDLNVQIETNGTLWVDLPEHPNLFIVCSPKTAFIHDKLRSRITSYKYVLDNDALLSEDGLPNISTQRRATKTTIARPENNKEVFVMPIDAGNETDNEINRRASVAIAMKHGYRLTLQSHKLLNIE